MSRMEGMSHKEIADHLQISTNTVKNHIVEALKTLKSKLHYAEYMLIFAFIHFF
jgi:DNA-directed RNA polymerase specialized sigma24 family protein